ncbi:MAG: hypothetical protein HYZ17_16335 [Betaproteobacteria bacterium]|nr:hypothetical protein [Betaproteobacteria bacterium]
MRIRSGSGLGDSIYLRPVVDYYVRKGHQVVAMSNFPDIFIGSGAKVEPFTRNNTNVLAHYTAGKARAGTNQWQDICHSARVGDLPLSFKWEIQRPELVRDLKAMARGKPIIMINGGRHPMGRKDGFGDEMLPRRAAFDAALAALGDCFTIEVGQGAELYPLTADVDLADRTSVADLLDIAAIASGLVGQCSFMIPLAEAFDKPLLCVWAAKGLISKTEFIRLCTPQKILSKPSSCYVMDDWPAERIQETARAFYRV